LGAGRSVDISQQSEPVTLQGNVLIIGRVKVPIYRRGRELDAVWDALKIRSESVQDLFSRSVMHGEVKRFRPPTRPPAVHPRPSYPERSLSMFYNPELLERAFRAHVGNSSSIKHTAQEGGDVSRPAHEEGRLVVGIGYAPTCRSPLALASRTTAVGTARTAGAARSMASAFMLQMHLLPMLLRYLLLLCFLDLLRPVSCGG